MKKRIFVVRAITICSNLFAQSDDGFYTTKYDNGQIKARGEYKNGKINGEFKHYHENGQLSFITQYDNGQEIGTQTYLRKY